MLTSSEIRRQFIDFFVKKHGHAFVASSPVVPHDDPTLLFTNAGMNQFKPYFLGTERPPNPPRVANTQKCIRAGGKHNDLEDVGKDTYHHTFFEMLGNWSFGDYFKKEAIAWAWELLTGVWGMDKTRLHVTVFEGNEEEGVPRDDEAAKYWREMTDINPAHIHLGNKKDNFWEMGETGPCGPCSEIHIDLTPDKSGANLVNAGDASVMEIWNLVFIQFNRDAAGKLTPLPAKHVDTGMGFERLCSVLQGKTSNYDTDVFAPIFAAIRDVTGAPAYGGNLDDAIDTAYRVIGDHIRTLTFALTDGAVPSNEGRGYVLRRILRRAVRHGWQTMGTHEPFLARLVPAVVDAMGDAFPELRKNPQKVADLIREEEESFERTLDRGIALFEQAAKGGKTVSADDAFKLHDTFGFPLDLTQVMAEERGMTVDVAGFTRLMDEAKERARAGGGSGDAKASLLDIVQQYETEPTNSICYDTAGFEPDLATVRLYAERTNKYEPVNDPVAGDRVAVVLDSTPFYAEAGGQVGDTGFITLGVNINREDSTAVIEVEDTVRVGTVTFHLGKVVKGKFPSGSHEITSHVDMDRRARTMANHTTTHIMNRALRTHVNPEADQKGSLVDPEKLRFDFSHHAAVTLEQMDAVEAMVNGDISADLPVYYDFAPIEQGRRISSLRAVFGEKYPPKVRIVSIGVPVSELLEQPENPEWSRYSVEFCGGTHLNKTGDAEGFAILSEEAVGKGVRRITALTGAAAHQATAHGEMLLARAEALSGAPEEQLATEIAELTDAMNEKPVPALHRAKIQAALGALQKKVKDHEKARSKEAAGGVVEAARRIADEATGPLIVTVVEGADGQTLRSAMDVIRKKRPDAAMLLASASDGKLSFLASVPDPLIQKGLKAGDWVREVAKVAGGGGGGRPDMAQAGGKDPAKLDDALAAARQFAQAKL